MKTVKKAKFESLNNEQFETLTNDQLYKMQGGSATDSSGITVTGTMLNYSAMSTSGTGTTIGTTGNALNPTLRGHQTCTNYYSDWDVDIDAVES